MEASKLITTFAPITIQNDSFVGKIMSYCKSNTPSKLQFYLLWSGSNQRVMLFFVS